MKKIYRMVIDSETCPLDTTEQVVSPSNMFAYDVGYAIVDRKGNVYVKRSFIIDDIFNKEADLMKSAYYAKKIPQYKADLKAGNRTLVSFHDLRKIMVQDMEAYDVKEVYAHNMRFDYGTLNNTQRYLTKSKYRYFFPYGTEICDTLKMCQQILGNRPTYKAFCEKHGYLTKHKTPRPQMTAEVIYRFITQNVDFVESHTALEDVMIEKDILKYLFRQHKKIEKSLWKPLDKSLSM